jgi:hypothetical protein
MGGEDGIKPGVARFPREHKIDETARISLDLELAREGDPATGCKRTFDQAESGAASDLSTDVRLGAPQTGWRVSAVGNPADLIAS